MSLNRKVYVAGPLTAPTGYQEKSQLYDLVIQVCKQNSFLPCAPHIEKRKRDHTRQVLSPERIFRWDYEHLKKVDLVVAYVGIPSIGVGMELGLAAEWAIPVISFCESNVEVSPMVLGHPTLIRHIQFEAEHDLLEKLNATFLEV
ncbi:hypothetical protein FBQ99_20500 [Chloroflexi bacterium CFX2]|nr:hypothetical protein [Chloroflexi bacterium CFX2]